MGKQNKLFKVYIFNVISKLALIMESQSTYKSLTALEIFVQICRDEHKKRFPDDVIALTEFVKQCSERWKSPERHQQTPIKQATENNVIQSNSSCKEESENNAKKNKDANNNEPATKAKTIEGDSENNAKKNKDANANETAAKVKKVRDPKAPKRFMAAFYWYAKDERQNVRNDHPEFGLGEIQKELGRRWANVSAEAIQKYQELEDKDRAREQQEKEAYSKK